MNKSVGLVIVFLVVCLMITVPVSAFTESAENSWVSKASMRQARSSLGAAVVNGKIYAVGGKTDKGVVGINEEYNPESDTWTYKQSMPTPRDSFAIASYENKIYCIGGYTSNGSITAVNEVYDPATNKWETKTPMPTARAHLQANVVNGIIYLIGGYARDNSTFRYSISKLNEVYDPATDTWMQKTPPTYGSYGYASAALDGKIYVLSGSWDMVTKMTQIYDIQSDTWTLGSSAPTYFMSGSVIATTGVMAPKRIYVFNKPAPDLAVNPNAPLFSTQVYDPKTDSWVAGADLPTELEGFAVAIENDKIYVIGGYSAVYRNLPYDLYAPEITRYRIVEQYTPFCYGTVPPAVSIVSPQSMASYASSDVPLNFSLSKPATWVGYSLDGKDNITITGNTTITGLSIGLHNITVYAKDANENIGASETITFTVAPPSFLTAFTAIAIAASVTVACVVLLLYFRKHKG